MKINKWLFVLLISLTASLVIFLFRANYKIALENPLSIFQIDNKKKIQDSKIVLGFLPYWNINKATVNPVITDIAYFALSVDGDGSIVRKEKNYTEPGYSKFQSDKLSNILDYKNISPHLVLTMFDNEKIETLLSDKENQNELLGEIDALLKGSNLTGINIDIEYTGLASKQLRSQFVNLVQDISVMIKRSHPTVTLSISMYASASKKQMIWDVSEIAKYVDYIVVMAYDFHLPSSYKAGPIAPIFGFDTNNEIDINSCLTAFTKQIDNSKIILGIPFYGYGWQTVEQSPQAHTIPNTGSTQTIKNVEKILINSDDTDLPFIQPKWDEESLSPYLAYSKDEKNYVIFYENEESIAYKLDYVDQLELAGIAIWALGYENPNTDIWKLIDDRFFDS